MVMKRINIKKLYKKFKNEEVLKGIDVEFESGKIYGIMGLNGSGKSVLFKIMCGFYMPSSGEVLFDGKSYLKNNEYPPSTRALIERPTFIPELSGLENLELLASIQNKTSKKQIDNAIDIVNLSKEKNKKYKDYSLGMKQKLGIAQVIMDNPDVLILDEPFNGIDKDSVKKIIDYLKSIKNDKIIIVSSHVSDDLNNLCDKIFVLHNGKLNDE